MNRLLIILSLLGLLVTACGPSKDDPLKDYRGLPAKPGPASSEPIVKYEYTEKEVPVEKEINVGEKIVYVEVEKEVKVPEYIYKDEPQVKASDDVFQVSRPKEIKLVEGQETSFEFTVKIQMGKVEFDIETPDLPKDAKIEILEKEANSAKYKFTWKAPLGSIGKSKPRSYGLFTVSLINLKFVAEDEKVNSDTQSVFAAISNSREIPFSIERTDSIPKIEITGLTDSTDTASQRSFYIDVKAPGTYEELKPHLMVFDDPEILTSETDVSPFVKLDKNRENPEKVSDSTWRYHYIFDQDKFQQYELVSGQTEMLVRVSFQAATPWGSASKKETVYFSVQLKPEAITKTTTTSPTADFSNMTSDQLAEEIGLEESTTITPEIPSDESSSTESGEGP